jgi:hypothetical protein
LVNLAGGGRIASFAVLKPLLASALATGFAAAIALTSVAQYTTVASLLAAGKQTAATPVRTTTLQGLPPVYSVKVDAALGEATLQLPLFTSIRSATALGDKYGMQVLAYFPSFGSYVYALPRIRVQAGTDPNTVVVYFPPLAPSSSMDSFLKSNGLTVQRWLSTTDSTGRTAVAALPLITIKSFDPYTGVYVGTISPPVDSDKFNAWAAANKLQINSYDPATGGILIQGQPTLVYRAPVKPVVIVQTNTQPQTSKLYIAFKPGTTAGAANQLIQQDGGQLTSYNSSTGVASANVPADKSVGIADALATSPEVTCVNVDASKCPGTTTTVVTAPAGGTASTSTTTSTTSTAGTTPSPSPTTGGGGGSGGGGGDTSTPTPTPDPTTPAPDTTTSTTPTTDTTSTPSPAPTTDSTPATSPAPTTLTDPTTSVTPAPAQWIIAITDSANHVIAIAASGADLSVSVDGTTSTRPASSVSGLTITGAAGNIDVKVDLSGGDINVPVVVDGGSGTNSLNIGIGPGSTWTIDGVGGGTVAGGGIASMRFSHMSSVAEAGTMNTLVGPAPDTTWTMTGPNSGTVDGMSFSGFQNLTGASGNKDTFVFEHGASLSGLLDGGPGGDDSLVLNGQTQRMTSTPSGPGSGTVTFEGSVINYTGLEPIVLGPTANVVVNGSAGNDTIVVGPGVNPNNIKVSDTHAIPNFESIEFPIPTSSLVIDGVGGYDTITFTVDLVMPGANLIVNAESIIVNPGVTINTTSGSGNGSITLNATDSQTGASDANALVKINGANILSGDLDISANGKQVRPGPGVPTSHDTANFNSNAEVSVLGASTITSKGNASLTSTSSVDSTVTATGSGGSTGVDAAVAASNISSTAKTHVSGTSSISAV